MHHMGGGKTKTLLQNMFKLNFTIDLTHGNLQDFATTLCCVALIWPGWVLLMEDLCCTVGTLPMACVL